MLTNFESFFDPDQLKGAVCQITCEYSSYLDDRLLFGI